MKVESSMLTEVVYEDHTEILLITFKNGRRAKYYKVAPGIYQKMMNAPSIGSFFTSYIRNAGYRWEYVDQELTLEQRITKLEEAIDGLREEVSKLRVRV